MDEQIVEEKKIDLDSFFKRLDSVEKVADSAVLKSESNLGIINEQKSLIQNISLSIEAMKGEIKEITNYIIVEKKEAKDKEEDRRLEDEDKEQKQKMTERALGLGGTGVAAGGAGGSTPEKTVSEFGQNPVQKTGLLGTLKNLFPVLGSGVANVVSGLAGGISGLGKGIKNLFKKSAKSTVPKEGDTIMSGKGMFGPESEDKENFINKFFNRKKKEIKEEIKEEIDVVDTKKGEVEGVEKGEVEGVEPPKPKRNRDEVTTDKTIKSDTSEEKVTDKADLKKRRERLLKAYNNTKNDKKRYFYKTKIDDIDEELKEGKFSVEKQFPQMEEFGIEVDPNKEPIKQIHEELYGDGNIMPSAMSPISDEDLARERELSKEGSEPVSSVTDTLKDKLLKFTGGLKGLTESPTAKKLKEMGDNDTLGLEEFAKKTTESMGGMEGLKNLRDNIFSTVGGKMSEGLGSILEKAETSFEVLGGIVPSSLESTGTMKPNVQPPPTETPKSGNTIGVVPQNRSNVTDVSIKKATSDIPFVNMTRFQSSEFNNIKRLKETELPAAVRNLLKIK